MSAGDVNLANEANSRWTRWPGSATGALPTRCTPQTLAMRWP